MSTKYKIDPTFQFLEDGNTVATSASILGDRKTQEDEEIIQKLYDGYYLYAIFDGHGGNGTSKWLKDNFIKEFLEYPKWISFFQADEETKENFDFELIFQTFYKYLDEKLHVYLSSICDKSGSTAIVVLQTPTKYICVTLGDSECWLLCDDYFVKFSEVLGPSNLIEKIRIIRAGGILKNDRIMGQLAISRAFGDFEFKGTWDKNRNKNIYDPIKDSIVSAVISVPIVNLFNRSEYEGTLLLGCDGFFDIMNDKKSPRSPTYIQNFINDVSKSMEDIIKSDVALNNLSNSNSNEEKVLISSGNISYEVPKSFSVSTENFRENIIKYLFNGYIPDISNIEIPKFDFQFIRSKYAEMLCRLAFNANSWDNISVILVTNNKENSRSMVESYGYNINELNSF